MMTVADAPPINEDSIALAIYHDLQSETPSYNYDLARAGKYVRQLERLISARKINLQAFKGTEAAILNRPGSELTQLIIENRKAETLTQDDQLTFPQLPLDARLPENFLPPKKTSKDWFYNWDSSQLRKVAPSLADYIAYSYEASPEGYVDFHIACALHLFSTVAGRRIYVPLKKRIYTPLAIALVARSSLFAKSETTDVEVKILQAAGLDWLSGDDETTPSQLLGDMAGHIPTNYGSINDIDQQIKMGKRLAMSGQIGWIYDEFNQLIDAMTRPGHMQDFRGLMRKLDNCPDEYRYSTRSHGKEIIRKPYIAFLGNTTPANLHKHARKGAEFWNDGFWARFLFVAPPPDDWIINTMDTGEPPIPPNLITSLQRWNERLGVPNCTIEEDIDDKGKGTGKYTATREELLDHEVTIDESAQQAYVRYRVALKKLIGKTKEDKETITTIDEDLDSNYSRLPNQALKIAALIASMENNNQIDLPIWILAQEITETFRRNLHELYIQVSVKSDEASGLEDILINYLKKTLTSKGITEVTAREISQYGPNEIRKLKADGIKDLLSNLERSGEVQCRKEGKKENWSLGKLSEAGGQDEKNE